MSGVPARSLGDGIDPLAGRLPADGADATRDTGAQEAELPRTLPFVVTPPLPEKIGRYAVRRYIDQGTFGIVYQGHDEQMDRPVAIKVSRAGSTNPHLGTEAFLREVRNVARLRH